MKTIVIQSGHILKSFNVFVSLLMLGFLNGIMIFMSKLRFRIALHMLHGIKFGSSNDSHNYSLILMSTYFKVSFFTSVLKCSDTKITRT